MTAARREDLIPAYRVKRDDGGVSLMFRCPYCRVVHAHGQPPSQPHVMVTGRVAACHDQRSPWFGRGYRLMVVGAVRSTKQLPECAPADLAALNQATADS